MILNHLRRGFATKKIIFGDTCKDIINETAQQIAKVVGITLGPVGRNVLFQNEKGEARITKDGITVLKNIEYENMLQDAISTLIKRSVNGTNKFAGDGTTTSTLLIGQIMKIGRKKMVSGCNIRSLKEGLRIGRDIGIEYFNTIAQRISKVLIQKYRKKEDYYKVAMVSSNGDKFLSQIISEAVSRAQIITVQRSNKPETSFEFYSGVKLVAGIPHPEFKNVGDKIIFDYPLVLLSKLPITKIEEIIPALQLAKKAKKQLLVIATSISESVMGTMIYNRRKNIVEACPLQIPDYGTKPDEYFAELSQSTGAYLFKDYSKSITEIDFEHLGKAVKVQMDAIETWITGKFHKQNCSAVIYSGGTTQAVSLEVYDKVIDALNSVQGAKKYGVVAGGGVAYWRLAQLLDLYEGQHKQGVQVLAEALRYPRRKLVETVPVELGPLRGQNWQGFNFKTGRIEDMFQVGIIDSVNVSKSVLIDSVSLTQLLLDIEVCIVPDTLNIQDPGLKDLIQRNKL